MKKASTHATRRTSFVRALLRLALALTLGAALATPAWNDALAASRKSKSERSSKKTKERPRGRHSQSASKKITTKLQAMVDLIGEEKYEEARKIGEQALRGRNLRDVEIAQLNRFVGFTYSSNEQYEKAIPHFGKAISMNALDQKTQYDLQFTLAQLYMATDEYEEAVGVLEDWLAASEEPEPKAYYYIAIAYTQMDRIDDAIPPAKKAVELADRPKESWDRLLINLYFQQQSYDEMLPLLQQMVRLFPKKNYWMQLSAVYSELDDDHAAMAVQQLAYVQGFLDQDGDQRRLARMYLYHDIPYWAAQVMTSGLENGVIEKDADSFELLANAWITAREFDKAVEPLAEAAELSETGDIYARLGQVYLEREEYIKAIDAIEAGIAKGELKNPGQAYLLLGICNFNADKLVASRRAFEKAVADKDAKSLAVQWITRVDDTIRNREKT